MQNDSLTQIKYRSLAQGAVEALRDAIITGKLSPGMRLVEQKLATQLGIGQPTLREALHDLLAITSTGWTMPRPMKRCQRRLAMVRWNRPLSGCVTSLASCSSRFAFGCAASMSPSSGQRTSAKFSRSD